MKLKFELKFLILIALMINIASAAVLEKDGEGFKLLKPVFKASELVEDYARIMNLNMSVAQDFQDETFEIYGKNTLTKDQVEGYVSRVLSISFHTMIVDPAVPFIQVIQSRDARYTTLPVYSDLKALPNNDNFVQFNYRLKFAEPADVARNMRPFLSRYGRVIDVKHAQSIHILDSADNVKRLIAIIQIVDVESYTKDKKEIEEINEKYRKLLKNNKSFLTIMLENNGIFLIVFMVLGLILGFGIRGYMMKRIEGGW
jgi:type II secretory pathway component GspD/PulD (secretin)